MGHTHGPFDSNQIACPFKTPNKKHPSFWPEANTSHNNALTPMEN